MTADLARCTPEHGGGHFQLFLSASLHCNLRITDQILKLVSRYPLPLGRGDHYQNSPEITQEKSRSLFSRYFSLLFQLYLLAFNITYIA